MTTITPVLVLLLLGVTVALEHPLYLHHPYPTTHHQSEGRHSDLGSDYSNSQLDLSPASDTLNDFAPDNDPIMQKGVRAAERTRPWGSDTQERYTNAVAQRLSGATGVTESANLEGASPSRLQPPNAAHMSHESVRHRRTSDRDVESVVDSRDESYSGYVRPQRYSVTIPRSGGTQHDAESLIRSLRDDEAFEATGHTYRRDPPVKMARFVADPNLVHLIEEVDEEELQRLKEATSTKTTTTTVTPAGTVAGQRVTEASATPAEAVTVYYEATKVPLLTYLWNEFVNLGDLLSREVLDTVSSRLTFLWRSVVKFVNSRGRRALPHAPHESYGRNKEGKIERQGDEE